jgi:hypothetical protein
MNYPCILEVLTEIPHPTADKVILRVNVQSGRFRKHTLLCYLNEQEETVKLGVVETIEHDNQELEIVEKEKQVECKIILFDHPCYPSEIKTLYSYLNRPILEDLKTIANQLTLEEKICCGKLKSKLKFK